MKLSVICAKSLTLILAVLLTAPVHAQVVLKRGDIEITVDDIHRYVLVNTPEDRRNELMQRPGIIREMAENLFIIRQLSATALETRDIDHDLLNWAIELSAARQRMDALLKQQVEATLENANWEAAAREVYAADGDKFVAPEQVRASHILVSTESRSDEEALELIASIKARVEAGESFAKLARELSDDPSAKQNRGDLGFFGRGAMVPEFEEAVFAMRKPNQLSAPVKSPFGYHLIQFKAYREGGKQAFDEVKEQIIAELQRQTRQKLRQEQIVAIRSVTDIEWNQALIDQLTKEYGGTTASGSRPSAAEANPVR